ncbi:unnamed protein product [Candida verbasci]|uniref:Uncharacterized protein n=1 Tax=Candida verbasci TaxID=1227364 RepID=A0A9W4TR33_9ASCO|nr:unnamed protein product [Candida verbasci]
MTNSSTSINTTTPTNQLTSPRIPNNQPPTNPGFSFNSPITPPTINQSISPRNSITSLNKNHNHHKNYTTTASPKRLSLSEFTNEQIIDLMEREQDAIVLKLMREIENLKNENKMLKQKDGGISRSNSIFKDESIIKKTKTINDTINHRKQSINSKYDDLVDENKFLKREIKKLQNELEIFKKNKEM